MTVSSAPPAEADLDVFKEIASATPDEEFAESSAICPPVTATSLVAAALISTPPAVEVRVIAPSPSPWVFVTTIV